MYVSEMVKYLICILLYISSLKSQSLYRYEIIIDHLELPKSELFDFATFRVKKYNRTQHVVTGYLDMLKPLSDELTARLDVYQFQGNEYRKLFTKDYKKICSMLRDEKMFVPKTLEKTSLGPEIKSCPIEPQRVHFYDFAFPSDFLPIQPPSGEKYRLDTTYFLDGIVLCKFSAFVILKKIDGLWKP